MLLHVRFIDGPLGQDEAVYFTVAQSNSLPYVEVFDQKPPLIYAWYKLALFLNGGEPSAQMVRGMAITMLAVTCVAVFFVARKLAGETIAAASAVSFALFNANQVLFREANTESFALLPLTLSLLFTLHRRYLIAGLLAGIAVVTKTSLVFPLLTLVLLIPPRDVPRLVLPAGAVLAAVSLPWLLSGQFSALWHANVAFNLKYGSAAPIELRPIVAVVGGLAAGIGSLALVIMALRGPRELPEAARKTCLLWGGGCALSVAATGLFLPYYFVVLFPALAILAGAGMVYTVRNWGLRKVRLRTEVLYIPVAVFTVLVVVWLYAAPSREAAYARRGGPDAEILAEQISSAIPQEGRLFVIGRAVQLYVLSGSEPATRVPLSLFARLDPALGEETVARLRASPPCTVVEIVEYGEEVDETALFRPLLDDRYVLSSRHEYKDAAALVWALASTGCERTD